VKTTTIKKIDKIMPSSKWYLSQRGMKAAERAFGVVTFKKKEKQP